MVWKRNETVIVAIDSTRMMATYYQDTLWLSLKVRLQCDWPKFLQMQSMFLTQQQANRNITSINNGCYIYNSWDLQTFMFI